MVFALLFSFPAKTQAFNWNTGTVTGVVYEDHNGNALRDGFRAEPGLTGWTVFVDTNNNALADSGEQSTKTLDGPLNPGLIDGVYWLRQVPTGALSVCVEPQESWLSTLPERANCREINLLPRQVKTAQNFGFEEVQEATLTIDVVTTPAENPQAFAIELSQEGTVIETVSLTDTDTPSSFSLAPGNYALRQIAPTDSDLFLYQQSCLVNGVETDPESLILAAGDSVECRFDNRVGSRIRVATFHDLDRDAMQNFNEPGLEGWEFAVYRGTECNVAENFVRQGVTGTDGTLILNGLFPDESIPVDYSVYPATLFDGSHDNWYETSGGNCRSVTIENFSSEKNLLFGIAEQL